MVERPDEAIAILGGPYRQLDDDGVIVGVSRQAIYETLAYLAAVEAAHPQPTGDVGALDATIETVTVLTFEELEAVKQAARDQGYNEGIEAAARYIQDQYPHDKRVLVPAIRKLRGSQA